MFNKFFRFSLPVLLMPVLFSSCCRTPAHEEAGGSNAFSFVFLTDIHLQPELDAPAGFRKAIDTVNSLDPDFVITGGDLVMDVLGTGFDRADSLYSLYDSMQGLFAMPVFNTMGNHEVFGIYEKSGVSRDHPEYGQRMYESRLGPSYYSFDHKGWHFMVPDGLEFTAGGGYIGMVDSAQLEWMRQDLEKVAPTVPIAVSVHIPLITVATQLEQGPLVANGKGTVINNAREVLDLFRGHTLKLVLQGHLHYLEEIRVGQTTFITAGAVSSRWWGGRYRGMEEGFVRVSVEGDEFSWE